MKKNPDAESVAESDGRFSLGSCGLGWQVDPAAPSCFSSLQTGIKVKQTPSPFA